MNMKELSIMAYTLRKDVIEMIHYGGSGHPGGSLSSAEILTALYFDVMNVDPMDKDNPHRDRFVLGKGHACPIVYAALARRGFFDLSALRTLRHTGSFLQGHPDAKKTPGLDASTGSLGQGLSIALGMALGAKQIQSDYHVFALLSDGEMQEGQIWEAAMAIAHYKLGNITALVDRNDLQVDGHISQVMGIEPLADKWSSFGWTVREVDGHDVEALCALLNERKAHPTHPEVIICNTIKGKGVSFMEDVMEWHASPITEEIMNQALSDLDLHIEHLS